MFPQRGHGSTTWPKLRGLQRLGVSVLAANQHRECQALAMKDVDRFSGVAWDTTSDDAIFIKGATAWLHCSLHSELAAGDHAIALLEIHGFRTHTEHAPLIFHGSRFRQLADIA